jgi:hypothetical protein
MVLAGIPFFLCAQESSIPPGTTADPGIQRVLEASETSAERHRREITEESSSRLINMDIYNTDVSLFINGYWKGSLGINWGMANSAVGTHPYLNNTPLLFTQETDITLSLWMWQKWFLEASFIDGYDVNTYRAGYQGLPGDTVQYVGVGNTGLDFPAFPYLDLGGDSSSSFGIYGRFGSDELTFHTLFRYDAAAREERIFTGGRERNFVHLAPDKPLRGRSFVLPDDSIPSVPALYFEDKDGDLFGGGRHWRRAKPSEYAVSALYGTVELAREPQGMVAVSYGGGNYSSSLGSYSSAAAPPFIPGTGFLGDVQAHFGGSIDLKAYPQPGAGYQSGTSSHAPAVISINGIPSLVIYEPGTFSPFERQSRYQAPSNTTEEAALLRSGERDTRYELLPIDALPADILLYAAGDTERTIFEVIPTGKGGRNRRDPLTMWPLDDYPELYLPGSSGFTGTLQIRFTNYGAAGAYYIGTDVIPGSVEVYRGGIPDTRIKYEPGSGAVTLASPAGFNETIRISYLKRSEERRLGSLAAGVGVDYKPEESPFSAEAALGMRWNIFSNGYSEEGASSPGTVGFGAKTSWDYERLNASITLGFGFEQPDTTGLYRIAGMEGRSEIVLGVSASAGFISESPVQEVNPAFPGGAPIISTPLRLTQSNRAGLIYRNYRKTGLLGDSELQSIEWAAPVVSGLEGPYPARDSNVEIFVAEFENLEPGKWTGFQIPLGRDGELLEQARGIGIPIRFLYTDSNPNVLVLAQFGALAEEGYGGIENPGLMVELPLFYGSPSSSWTEQNNIPGGKYPVINFTDEMRRKLQNAAQLRILIINLGNTPLNNRLLVAKPFIMGASWRAVTLEGGKIKAAADDGADGSVSAAEVRDGTLGGSKIDRLHESGTNHVLKIEWNNIAAAGADGRTSAIPLSNYRVLSFYLKGPLPEGAVFHFLVSQGPDVYGQSGKTALELTAPISSGHPFTGASWHAVEIHYGNGNRFLIDGVEFPGAIRYNPSALRQSPETGDYGNTSSAGNNYIAAFFTGLSGSGSFSIDELCLEEPAPSYRMNGGTTLNWNHPDTLLSIGKTELISRVSFNTALESAVRGDPFNSGEETFAGVQSRSHAEAAILDAMLTGNLMFTVSGDVSGWSAGHSISRSFGPLSLSESFNASPPPNDEAMDHKLSLGLDSLLYGNLASSVNLQNRMLNRSWSASTGINAEQNAFPGFSVEGNVNYTEKPENAQDWISGYGQTWMQSWKTMVPDDGTGSDINAIQNRKTQARAGFVLDWLPVGADLFFEGKSEASIPLELSRSSSIANVVFPFSFRPVRGSMRLRREISGSFAHTGENIQDDFFQYGRNLYQTAPLWRTIPVYSFFDPGLGSAMDTTLMNYSLNSENTRFNESLGMGLMFPERYDILSLFVPVTFSSQLSRTMEQRLDTRLDVLTLGSGLSFSAVNLFGAMGSHPVFGFYRNDELRHSVTGIVSFPRSEDPLWRVQAEQYAGVYGFKGSEMGIDNTYTASSSGWLESFGLVWSIPRDKTLLSAIYDAGIKKFSGSDFFPALSEMAKHEYERFFRETLEVVVDNSEEYGTCSFTAGHESVVRMPGKLTLTSFIKLSINRNIYKKNERNDLLGVLLNFGITLAVSF